MKKRIVVLFSGDGSNFENIVTALHNKEFDGVTIEVAGAICNRHEANGINRANKLGIKCEVIDHKSYDSREAFDAKLISLLEDFGYDLCVMAGFMRILSPVFTSRVLAVNIHPSFLPHFKGADSLKKSFESGMGFGGVSIHWVNAGVDEGQIISQEKVYIEDGDTFELFRDRVQAKEHEMYPKAILEALKSV